eukprot:jgi/Mesvir1/13959/Mv26057-RA.1
MLASRRSLSICSRQERIRRQPGFSNTSCPAMHIFRYAYIPLYFALGFVLFRFGTLLNVVACITMLRGRLFEVCFRQQRERRPSLLGHNIRCVTSRKAGMTPALCLCISIMDNAFLFSYQQPGSVFPLCFGQQRLPSISGALFPVTQIFLRSSNWGLLYFDYVLERCVLLFKGQGHQCFTANSEPPGISGLGGEGSRGRSSLASSCVPSDALGVCHVR